MPQRSDATAAVAAIDEALARLVALQAEHQSAAGPAVGQGRTHVLAAIEHAKAARGALLAAMAAMPAPGERQRIKVRARTVSLAAAIGPPPEAAAKSVPETGDSAAGGPPAPGVATPKPAPAPTGPGAAGGFTFPVPVLGAPAMPSLVAAPLTVREARLDCALPVAVPGSNAAIPPPATRAAEGSAPAAGPPAMPPAGLGPLARLRPRATASGRLRRRRLPSIALRQAVAPSRPGGIAPAIAVEGPTEPAREPSERLAAAQPAPAGDAASVSPPASAGHDGVPVALTLPRAAPDPPAITTPSKLVTPDPDPASSRLAASEAALPPSPTASPAKSTGELLPGPAAIPPPVQAESAPLAPAARDRPSPSLTDRLRRAAAGRAPANANAPPSTRALLQRSMLPHRAIVPPPAETAECSQISAAEAEDRVARLEAEVAGLMTPDPSTTARGHDRAGRPNAATLPPDRPPERGLPAWRAGPNRSPVGNSAPPERHETGEAPLEAEIVIINAEPAGIAPGSPLPRTAPDPLADLAVANLGQAVEHIEEAEIEIIGGAKHDRRPVAQ